MAKRTAIQEVTLLEIETVAHRLAQEFLDWGEPIPVFETRFPDKLESCLVTPFQKFGGRSLYAGLVGKGSVLFYFMIKNHPFQNGNKRVAVMTLLYFLFKNGYWLSVSNDEFYLFAKEIAMSDPKDRAKVNERIHSFVRKNLVKNS